MELGYNLAIDMLERYVEYIHDSLINGIKVLKLKYTKDCKSYNMCLSPMRNFWSS